MKRNEIALLILIVGIVSGAGYYIGQSLLGNQVTKPVKVETAQPITAEVSKPSDTIFNENSINPTVNVTIGTPNNNDTPFGN
jgi:glucose uptake protein GlcU